MLETERPPLPILYRDEHCIIIDKPPGLLIHPSRIAKGKPDTALDRLRDQLGAWVFPVHRLDRPTSGALLFGLDKEAAQLLAPAFRNRQVQKVYLALVRGHTPHQGRIDLPLLEKRDRKTDAHARRDKPAQDAITDFRILANGELARPVGRYQTGRYSLLEVIPQTGRRHQIRRHLKHLSHPIIGDTTHGDRDHNRLFRETLGLERMFLMARSLRLPSPFAAKGEIHALAPLGDAFTQALAQIFPKLDLATLP